MIYDNQSISYRNKENIAAWMLMAFQAGSLNIGGFMACHRFVSHVTGFATFFGYELSRSHVKTALSMLAAPFFFLLGCFLSGLLVDIRLKQNKKPRYYVVFGLIFLLISAVWLMGLKGLFGTFGEEFLLTRDYILLALLCLICGLQNGTVTTASRSVLRTTHLTGLTTDLGIGLARLLHRKKLGSAVDVSNEVFSNFFRVGIIISFTFGSAIGAFLFSSYSYNGFLLPVLTAGLLFFVMLRFRRQEKKSQAV